MCQHAKEWCVDPMFNNQLLMNERYVHALTYYLPSYCKTKRQSSKLKRTSRPVRVGLHGGNISLSNLRVHAKTLLLEWSSLDTIQQILYGFQNIGCILLSLMMMGVWNWMKWDKYIFGMKKKNSEGNERIEVTFKSEFAHF